MTGGSRSVGGRRVHPGRDTHGAVCAVPMTTMARMHSRRRGSSGSERPAADDPPEWSDVDADAVEERVVELAEEGHSPSEIGLVLRDEGVQGTPVPDVKLATGKKVTEILEEHDGEVPDTMTELTELPGVGRKTANVVLQHGHEVVEGIVVDTHVRRISRRLGLTEEHRPEAIEEDLVDVVPREDWKEFTHLLISHGRATCTARNPDCEDCTLEDVCPSSKLDGDVDLADGSEW